MWRVAVGEQSPSGAIQGMLFLPGALTVHVGDTVRWTAASAEPHTVSFLDSAHPAVPFDPSIAYMTTRTPETTIDAPGQFRNSGLMTTMHDPSLGPNQYSTYDLVFPAAGDYPYLCYVHGVLMSGTVHVVPHSSELPHSQRFYNREYRKGRAAIIADGRELREAAREASSDHHVMVGATDNTTMLMRMVPGQVEIRVGETVDFDMNLNTIPVPHTVTFGNEPGAPIPVGDPTNFHLGQDLSSGVMLAASLGVPNVPNHFRVTFKAPGTYHYICTFHDMMGMHGTVVVR